MALAVRAAAAARAGAAIRPAGPLRPGTPRRPGGGREAAPTAAGGRPAAGRPRPRAAHRADELPQEAPVGGDLQEAPALAVTDQEAAVRQVLHTRDVARVEALALLGRPGDERPLGQEAPVDRRGDDALVVRGELEHDDRREARLRAALAVVEDRERRTPVHARPAHVVLAEQLAVLGAAVVVLLGVAPAPDEVAPHALAAALGAARLLGGRGVVDHPHLAEVAQRERDEVELGVVADGVAVHPVRAPAATAGVRVVVRRRGASVAERAQALLEGAALRALLLGLRLPRGVGPDVHVDAPRVLGDDAVPRALLGQVLDEVVEGVPLPHDLDLVRPEGLQLEDGVGPEALRPDGLRVPAGERRGAAGLPGPGDREQVAVGERLEVVVQALVVVAEPVLPDDLAVPGGSTSRPPSPPAVMRDPSLSFSARSRCPSSVR